MSRSPPLLPPLRFFQKLLLNKRLSDFFQNFMKHAYNIVLQAEIISVQSIHWFSHKSSLNFLENARISRSVFLPQIPCLQHCFMYVHALCSLLISIQKSADCQIKWSFFENAIFSFSSIFNLKMQNLAKSHKIV